MTPYWTDVLDRLAPRRIASGVLPFAPADVTRAGRSWTTCACGEQDDRIPRNAIGEPLDGDLAGAGLDFASAVEAQDLDAARALLLTIEQRAAEILGALR